MRTRIAVIVGASIGLGLGLGLGIALRGDAPDTSATRALAQQALAQADVENEELRRRIAQLEARLASTPDLAPIAPTPADEAGRDGEAPATGDAEEASAEEMAELEANAAASAFDAARLLALGFHPSDIEHLRRTWEAIELEKLYIQNERARSDVRDGRYWSRILALEREAIRDLGEEDYDALLYASGAQNRVRVRNVLPGSAAEASGMRPGDEIIAYDEEPIYRLGAVKQGTIRCEPGRSISVGVLQDGVDRRVWVPCGPLGVELERVRAEPR